MGFGRVLRERYAPIRFLVNAQKTIWYQILFAVLCIISGTHGYNVYLPIIFVLCSFVIFSAIFTDDNKVFLTPLLMIFYSMGIDHADIIQGYGEYSLIATFEPWAFNVIIICGIICMGVFVTRLIVDGSVALVFKKKRLGLISILILDVAFLLNGAFSPSYSLENLLYGFIMAVGFTLFYVLTVAATSRSQDVLPYACKAMVCTAYVALGEFAIIAVRALQDGRFFMMNSQNEITGVNRADLNLSWGLSTIIAAVFVLGIPAAMYLARTCKAGVLSISSAILFVLGTVLINTRSATLVGSFAFIACAIVCCIKDSNKKTNLWLCRISCIAVFSLGIFLVARLLSDGQVLDKMLEFLRFENYDDVSRIGLWNDGIADFKQNPLFGIGFADGGFGEVSEYNNFMSNMYHCILIQFMGAMGAVGCVAFIAHAVYLGYVFLKGISVDKFLVVMVMLMILGMSLVDNFFFYTNFQIIYCVFLVLAEDLMDRSANPLSLSHC